jgi:hypothetical protein
MGQIQVTVATSGKWSAASREFIIAFDHFPEVAEQLPNSYVNPPKSA